MYMKSSKPSLKGDKIMNAKVKIYNGVKYELSSEKVEEDEYKNIRGYEVVTGDRATKIGLETDKNSRDEFNEYLIITLENGETATLCNSRADMFIIQQHFSAPEVTKSERRKYYE